MSPAPAIPKQFVLACAIAGLLGACASNRTPAPPAEPPLRAEELRDFSGNWEKNYQLSDDFQSRFGLFIADIQRVFVNPNAGSIQGGPSLRGGGAGFNVASIEDLARFTEELTRMPLIEINQDDNLVEIERENDFTLRCAYGDRQFVRSGNAFGSEVCGWNAERLQFQMQLGGGLSIAHQFSLSPDATMLNVTTTVSSDTVPVPMVISNYYTRFTPVGDDYNCMLTLTRRTVCSQRGTPQ